MDFIFDNWVVFLFIIGAITSVLKKLKESNNDHSRTKQTEWKKGRDFPPIVHENQPEILRSDSKPSMKKEKRLEKYEDRKEVSEKSIQNEKITSIKHTSQQREKRKEIISEIEKNGEDFDFTPKKDNVIEGVIWAEILGPPRALKSHSTRRIAKK
ncbi:hypothetical protein ACFSO7_19300 [Bacillus sp. CGMCC 1.16607]|uniref:hypothetical protein n=1 Tax=Bacillus sp. CGMCC 1.16607 TaxID=3351842 RepID=UPI003627FC58